MTKTFATASNARRAAREDGHELVNIDIIQDGARFSFAAKAEATVEQIIVDPVTLEANAIVALAAEDGDYGMVKADEARDMAQTLANEEGITIYVRNPISDEVLYSVGPITPETATQQEPQAVIEAIVADTIVADTITADPVPASVSLTFETFCASNAEAVETARAWAKKLGLAIIVTDREGGIDVTVTGPAVKAERAPQAPREVKASTKQPGGKTAQVIDLAARPEGATPAELIAATGWTGAPWKYNFQKWSAQYGYAFEVKKVGEGEAKETRYFLWTVNTEAAAAA